MMFSLNDIQISLLWATSSIILVSVMWLTIVYQILKKKNHISFSKKRNWFVALGVVPIVLALSISAQYVIPLWGTSNQPLVTECVKDPLTEKCSTQKML